MSSLAAAAHSQGEIRRGRQIPEGPVPLTHTQARFAEQDPPYPHHFNQSVMIAVPSGLDAGRLKNLLTDIVARHDALHFRIFSTAKGWLQEWRGVHERTMEFETRDLSSFSGAEREQNLAALAAAYHSGLNLEHGPLMRVGLLRMGAGRRDRLLFVVHHLVIDGVSWRILLEDLEIGYSRQLQGKSPLLSPTSTPFREWAVRLQDFAKSERLSAQLDYWINQPEVEPLPTDFSEPSANAFGHVSRISSTLETEATSDLLQRVGQAYQTRINDALLGALLMACRQWTGEPRLLVEMEAHGREEIFEDLDLTRTLGWFTSLYPVVLEAEAGDVGAVLKTIKEQLLAVPDNGIGYGVARYLHQDARVRKTLRMRQPAMIRFNYLGQTDQTLSKKTGWSLAEEPTGEDYHPENPRGPLLELHCIVDRNQLNITWTYNRLSFHPQTIEILDRNFRDALRQIIEHCRHARGFTPSDFPLARLTQGALDALIASLAHEGAEPSARFPEDMYPLSPMQAGMLFHAFFERETQTYFEQVTCIFEGPFAREAFIQAWDDVIAHHAVLRTSFHWQGMDLPLQVVAQSAEARWRLSDWRGLDDESQERQWRQFLETDREKGFSFSTPPLLRFHLAALKENRFRFCLSYHHILLDGWSSALLFQRVLQAYQARLMGKPHSQESETPYRNYIAWLQRQNAEETEAYWKLALRGFREPVRLGTRASGAGKPTGTPEGRLVSGGYREILLELDEGLTQRLVASARGLGLTLNTCIHGVWAILCGHHGETMDVVYGATVSGRPTGLDGVEKMVGLFINTLPIRVVLKGDASLPQWLQDLQEAQAERDPHAHAALVDIQGWSEVPRGAPLFESLLVFENYPMDQALDEKEETLTVREVRAIQHSNYPLTLTIKPGSRLLLEFGYDSQRLEAGLIQRLRDQFKLLLERLPEGVDPTLKELMEMLAQWDRDNRETEETALKSANILQLKRAGRKARVLAERNGN